MKIKLTFSGRSSVIDAGATLGALKQTAAATFALPRAEVALYAGVPRKVEVIGDDDAALASVGIEDMSAVEVRRSAAAPSHSASSSGSSSSVASSISGRGGAGAGAGTGTTAAGTGQWTCEVCTFVNGASSSSGSSSGSSGSSSGSSGSSSKCEMCEAPRPPPPRVERHVVPADNNCLFTSMGYLLDNQMDRAGYYRSAVAAAIRADPATFNAAVLGRTPAAYEEYIKNPQIWGGGIELSVLSNRFACEIIAVEIRNAQPVCFGEGRGYTKRAYLLYDGLHYDPVHRRDARTGAITRIFDPKDKAAYEGVVGLARELQSAKAFTDLHNFKLQCGVCYAGLTGEAQAVEHAKATGHTNFQEYDPTKKAR